MPELNRWSCVRSRFLAQDLCIGLICWAGLAAVNLALSSCASNAESQTSAQGSAVGAGTEARTQRGADSPSRDREPYTTCFEVLHQETLLGYLLSYEAPPVPDVERSLPTGSSRILDLRFDELGFVTSTGAFHRFDEQGDAPLLGNFPLQEGLRRFFAVNGPLLLRPLREAVANERALPRS